MMVEKEQNPKASFIISYIRNIIGQDRKKKGTSLKGTKKSWFFNPY